MSGNTQTKKNHIKRNVAIIVVIAAALVALRFTVYEVVKAKVVNAAFEKVVLNEICNSDDEGTSSYVAMYDISDKLNKEDRKTVEKIILSKLSIASVKSLLVFIANGDSDSLKQFAQENFTESELEELTGIYYKYAN